MAHRLDASDMFSVPLEVWRVCLWPLLDGPSRAALRAVSKVRGLHSPEACVDLEAQPLAFPSA